MAIKKPRELKVIPKALFLKNFKKNCQELLTTNEMCSDAINWIRREKCPFPWVCGNASIKYWGESLPLCPGDGDSHRRPEDCPVNPEWQRQVAYFWKNRRCGALQEKMTVIVEGVQKALDTE